MLSGFQVVPVLMGAFAMPQIIEGLRQVEVGKMIALTGRILPNMRTMRKHMPTIARSGVIGTGSARCRVWVRMWRVGSATGLANRSAMMGRILAKAPSRGFYVRKPPTTTPVSVAL
jgi:hypothetical protein